jgi:hypothetical protein
VRNVERERCIQELNALDRERTAMNNAQTVVAAIERLENKLTAPGLFKRLFAHTVREILREAASVEPDAVDVAVEVADPGELCKAWVYDNGWVLRWWVE